MGDYDKARNPCSNGFSGVLEMTSNLKKLPTIKLAMERSTVQSCLAAPALSLKDQ
jgi:hypothetical protein